VGAKQQFRETKKTFECLEVEEVLSWRLQRIAFGVRYRFVVSKKNRLRHVSDATADHPWWELGRRHK
jgi:hypothetical protein